MEPSPTRPGRLSEVARHLVLPSGIVATGWPGVREKSRELGIVYDPWQDGAGRAILAKRADGLYAAGIGGVVISIPRQVGKTFLIGGIVFALCLLYPNLTVIWTAHRLRTAGETFRSMQGMARRKRIKPHVRRIVLGSGDEAIEFMNGSRILFGARERGFGLGFAMVDVLVLDEAQRLTDTTMDDLIPTMNAAPNPLLILTGTPPRPTDSGEVFTNKRREALAGESEDMLYLEFSADPDGDANSRRQWRKANPSYPDRTPESAMLRMRKNLGEESFWREGLGVWDSDGGGKVIPAGLWRDCKDEDSQVVDAPVVVLDASPMLSMACLMVAGTNGDGKSHVEIMAAGGVLDYRPGSEWVVPRLAAIAAHEDAPPVWVVAGSAAESLVTDLEAAGVEVHVLSRADYASACVRFAARVRGGQVAHIGQPELTTAVAAGAKRAADEGLWTWGRVKSSADITPLVAATAGDWIVSQRDDDYDVMNSVG